MGWPKCPHKVRRVPLEVSCQGWLIWKSQKHLADFFAASEQNINMHIANVLVEIELEDQLR